VVPARPPGLDNTGRGVELAAPLPFGAGKLTKEIFVHLAQQIAGALPGDTKADGGDHVHQLTQLAIGQLHAGIAFVEDAFELGILCLNQGQGIINPLADIGLLGLGPQVLPAGRFRHPEDVDFTVVVPVFQFADQPAVSAS
jgi:hypothetical protein